MPQFTYDPNNPNAVVVDVATGGDVFGQKREAPAPSGGSASTTTTPAPAPKKKKKKRKPEKPTTPAYNPFTAPFKTPAELRAEAARLAALGSPTEEALRAQQQQEEAGLAGLTGGLSTALRGVSEAQTAGLAGLGSLYQQLGGAAQSAAQSAAAAAGAPTSIAPGTTPTAIASFLPTAAGPGLGAVVRAYESVAPVIGAQLVGASRANLAKALTQRASQISSDTAKYLRQLQQEEIDRAIAQQTSEQNLARLGLQQQEQQFGQQIDLAQLQQGQQRIDLSAQRLAAQLLKDAGKPAKDKAKQIKKKQDQILNNRAKWTKATKVGTGEYNFKFSIGGESYEATGRNANDAFGKLLQSGSVEGDTWDSYTQGSEITRQQTPTTEDIVKMLQPILTTAGMNPKNARNWILRNVLNIQGSPGGAFMGGVV